MSKFDKFLVEMSLPSGFSEDDVMSLDEFMEEEEGYEAPTTAFDTHFEQYMGEDITGLGANIEDIDIEDYKQKRATDAFDKGVEIAKRPQKLVHKKLIVGDDGNIIDDNALRKQITKRPKTLLSQNEKMKASGKASAQKFFDISLPSFMGLVVDEDTGEFKVVKTCPSAGECSKFCYAAKGNFIRYVGSGLKQARVVNYLLNDPEGFKNQLIKELNVKTKSLAKKNMTPVLRWHDSGDFLSEKYLDLAFDVARQTPDVLHYAYTKQVPMVQKKEAEKPDNFVFNFSFGGEHDEKIDTLVSKYSKVVPYELFADLPQKKAPGSIEFPPLSLKTLKRRVAKEFNVNPNSVISYDELLQTPQKKGKRWNVLVWKGHGDDSATRSDVAGTFLLFH